MNLFILAQTFLVWLIRPPAEIVFDPSRWRFFFAYRESPSYSKITLPANSVVTRLPSFGFDQNGTFSVKLTSRYSSESNISNVRFVFVEQQFDFHFSIKKFCQKGSKYINSDYISFGKYANNNISEIPHQTSKHSHSILSRTTNQVGHTNKENDTIIPNTISILNDSFDNRKEKVLSPSQNNLIQTLEWNGTVLKKGIYSPYLIDCTASSQSFTSLTRFENPDIFDFRERGISMTLKGLSILYPSLTVLWILNGLSFPQFFVDMHHFLTFLPLFKSGVLILESELYCNKYVDPIDVAWTLTASVVLHTSLLIILLLIANGWCTYEESIQPRDVLIYTLISLTMLSCCALSNYSVLCTYLCQISVAAFIILIAITYARIIRKLRASRQRIAQVEEHMQIHENESQQPDSNIPIQEQSTDSDIQSSISIDHEEEEMNDDDLQMCDPNYVKKLEMVLSFMNCCTVNMILFFVLDTIAMWLNAWIFVRIIIVELGVLINFILLMCFFFYRANHAPLPVLLGHNIHFGQNFIMNNFANNKKLHKKGSIKKFITRKLTILVEPNERHMFLLKSFRNKITDKNHQQ